MGVKYWKKPIISSLIYTKLKILFMKKIYLNFSHRYIYTVRLYLQLYPILSYPMIDIQYFQTYL